ncbi:PREDICTED: taperin [Calidris pugnax]|uniref:taperin n=1 Tax=Calidris pugnax TaxID=198806 RepID=UPI00071D9CF4|nr:PREDICTED: taperin [Calidris pugnax]
MQRNQQMSDSILTKGGVFFAPAPGTRCGPQDTGWCIVDLCFGRAQWVTTAPKAAAPQANCFLHKIGSNSFTVTPRGLPPGSRLPESGAVPAGRPAPPKGPPVPSASPSHARANARRPKPEEAEAAVSPPPSASLAPSATGSTQPLSASAPRAGGSFEIHPAPKPDLAAIPAHDLQAQTLAKLRLNSRNSFVFVPRREGSQALPPTQSARPGPPPPPSEEKAPKEPPRASTPEQEEPIASPPAPLEPSVPVTFIDDIVEPESGELSPRSRSAARTGSLAGQPGGASPDVEMEVSSVPLYRPHSVPHQRGGNTFTVVPKSKPVASGLQTLADASGRPQREEEEEESKGKAVENADGPQAGVSHKKRYPTVNEIEVIGGYLSLERSCMSKTGSRRKKMKISFNETSLQTMFEYPSESSLAEEDEEEEDGHASETEEDKSCTFYIPRPNSTLHPSTPNSADLSSYTPKHSVKFSEWQEQKYEEIPAAEGALPKEADAHGSQVMLTPAEKGGLSDFSSEPALDDECLLKVTPVCELKMPCMKISFNETSLQTMFEYPSESSLAEEDEEEEDGHASETEEDKSCTFYIPRPNSTLHPSTPNSADLSSYTPKHSVKFSEWQEQKYEEIPAAEGALPKEADAHGSQVMLTPAEKGGLSDFSSEPALYF